MMCPKLSVDALRKQFDREVDRFSDETIGQATAVDSLLVLEMVERSIAHMQPNAERLCDIGCGAGNFSLRIARRIPDVKLTILDLSRPMLDRAKQRLEAEHFVVEHMIQADIKDAELPKNRFDIVVAGASLHHLRDKADWMAVFRSVFDSLRPGGTFWIWDLIKHENETIEAVQKKRYADYLISFKDESFQQHVFDDIDASDSPESMQFLWESLTKTGFRKIDILHKNTVFMALLACKNG